MYENLGMAQLSLAQGSYDQAIAYLLKSDPGQKTAIARYWLSAAYAAKGDKPKALDSLQAAFKLGYGDFASLDASPISRPCVTTHAIASSSSSTAKSEASRCAARRPCARRWG